MDENRKKALAAALGQIEKQFGKGSVMRMGDGQAARDIEVFGAQGITIHPRPDERHIRYQDVRDIKPIITTEFNIEGYPSEDFLRMVIEVRADQVQACACCRAEPCDHACVRRNIGLEKHDVQWRAWPCPGGESVDQISQVIGPA